MLDVCKQTEIPPENVAIDDGNLTTPSLSSPIPHIGNNDVHISALKLLLIYLVGLLKVIP